MFYSDRKGVETVIIFYLFLLSLLSEWKHRMSVCVVIHIPQHACEVIGKLCGVSSPIETLCGFQ